MIMTVDTTDRSFFNLPHVVVEEVPCHKSVAMQMQCNRYYTKHLKTVVLTAGSMTLQQTIRQYVRLLNSCIANCHVHSSRRP